MNKTKGHEKIDAWESESVWTWIQTLTLTRNNGPGQFLNSASYRRCDSFRSSSLRGMLRFQREWEVREMRASADRSRSGCDVRSSRSWKARWKHVRVADPVSKKQRCASSAAAMVYDRSAGDDPDVHLPRDSSPGSHLQRILNSCISPGRLKPERSGPPPADFNRSFAFRIMGLRADLCE